MSSYLDKTGLSYLVSKIKNLFVAKETGKGLSTNDYITADKNKLAGIEEQANKTVVDSALSSSSTNPVQNKVVNSAISSLNENKAEKSMVEEIVQESAFDVAVEGDDFVLYWYGATDECPYSVSLEDGEYVLYFDVA